MLIDSMSVSVNGFIAYREGAFGWGPRAGDAAPRGSASRSGRWSGSAAPEVNLRMPNRGIGCGSMGGKSERERRTENRQEQARDREAASLDRKADAADRDAAAKDRETAAKDRRAHAEDRRREAWDRIDDERDRARKEYDDWVQDQPPKK